MDIAPIIVFAYNRADKLSETLDALKANELADKSDLFIYLDGPKSEQDLPRVDSVRKVVDALILNESHLFNSINCTASPNNKGLAKSIIGGVTEIINKYGKVIVIEDDIITSSYFLRFMNGALNYYQDNQKIWGVSGYSPRLDILEELQSDVWFSWTGASWGWATWKNRWNTVDWDVKDYGSLSYKLYGKRKLRRTGYIYPAMLDRQMRGVIDSWAIRWAYSAAKQNKLTVYPQKSLVVNEGFDDSGTHCSSQVADRYKVILWNNNSDIVFIDDVHVNKKITRQYKNMLGRSDYKNILKRKLKKLLNKIIR